MNRRRDRKAARVAIPNLLRRHEARRSFALEPLEKRELMAVLPPASSTVYIQTNGPTAPITLGDWYTSNANGTGAGSHYFQLDVPKDWPTNLPVMVDLFSPEMNSNAPLSDEVGTAGNPLPTTFELYGPNTPIGPAPNVPAPGAAGSLLSHTYAPSSAFEQWVRFATLPAPVTPGKYVLRAETSGGDQNGWKLRLGTDNDSDPTNAPPPNYDNPDGLPGTDDELTIGIIQTSFQHDVATSGVGQSLTLYSYVDPQQPTVAFHNFDMDGNLNVRYYSPSQTADPLAQTGGTVGTLSGNGVWNNGTTTSRGTGDVITNPESGWWKIVTVVGSHNQYVQEAQAQVASYYQQPPTPVLSLTKDDGTTTAAPGDTLDYTLHFTNTSSGATAGAALSTVLTDTLPANVSFVSASIDAPYTGTITQTGNQIRVTINQAIFAGAAGSVHILAKVDPTVRSGTVANSATLSYQDGLGNPMSPTSASDTDTIVPRADLQITNDDGRTAATPGQAVTYTVVVHNAGPNDITGASITDPFSVRFTGVTYTATQTGGASGFTASGSGSPNDLVNLPNGSTITYLVTATISPSATGSVSTTATVTMPSGTTDPTPSNNSATDTDKISAAAADLAVTQTVSDATPNVGQDVTFTLTLNNAGPSDASNVAVTDSLPSGLSYVSSTPGLGTYDSATGAWAVGAVPNQAGQTLILVAKVVSPNALVNTATLTGSSPPDSNASNNSASVTETPQRADLTLSESVSTPTPQLGQDVFFSVTLTNNGPDDATSVAVTDLLPAGLDFVSSTTTAGIYDSTTGVWSIAAAPISSTNILTIRATVSDPNVRTNSANITQADQYDPDTTNNSASATETPQRADLALAESIDNPTPNVGDVVSLTLTLSNLGPDPATTVVINDLLPSGLNDVSDSASSGSYDSSTGNWALAGMASQSTATLVIRAKILGSSSQSINASVGSSDKYDPVLANNSASASETPQQANLTLTKTVDNATPNVGDTITFTITLANSGPNSATGVTVSDPLPAGLSFLSASPAQGSYDSATGLWTVGSVSSGSPLSLTVQALVNDSNAQTNVAAVAHSDQFDPNPNDNTASVSESPQQADLTLAQTVSNVAPNVGDTVTFTLTLDNAGPNDASSVNVTDVLPAGVSFVSASPSQGTYDQASGIWSVGPLASGGQLTLTLQALVNSPNPQTNPASISHADQFDPVLANNSASASESPQQADLAIAQSISNATPNVGDTISLTLTLVNNGPDTASQVLVSDILPGGLSFTSATTSQGTYDASTGDWTVGTIANGGQVILALTAVVQSSSAQANTAVVSVSDQFDPITKNNSASAGETPQAADLAVIESISDPTPNVGDMVTLTIQLTNQGPDAATNVALLAPLPAGLVFLGAAPTQGAYDPAKGIWTVGSVGGSGTATLTITAWVNSPSPQTNPASILASDQFDPDPANNSARATESPRHADLSILKTVNHATATIGDTVTFTLTLHNNGPDQATGVTVSDPLPSGLQFVSSNAIQGQYDGATGLWTVGSIASGVDTTLTIVTQVTSAGPLTNTARVSHSDVYDPDPSNDASSVTEDALVADLAVTKTISDARPNVGDTITITTTLTNNGPDDATGVAVTDLLPAGLTFVSSTPSVGSYDASTGIWSVGAFPKNGAATLALTVKVDSPNAQTSSATVTHSDLADPVTANHSASSSETPRSVHLSLTSTVDNPTPKVGDTIHVTLRLDNSGPDPATNVSTLEMLPPGLSFVSSTPSTGNYDPASGIWAVPSVTVGGSQTLVLTLKLVSPNIQSTPATVVGQDQFDATPVNTHSVITVTPQSSLSGRVYVDANGNGSFDSGETPIAGVTITLSGTDQANNPVSRTAVTDGNGLYTFNGLLPGVYTLRESQPAGFNQGKDGVGTSGGSLTTQDLIGQIALPSGTDSVGYTFGEVVSSVSGTVFLDQNSDGIREAGEPGLGGVAISLHDAQDRVVASTTTAADGSFAFGNEPLGSYTLVETQPAGYGISTPERVPLVLAAAGNTPQTFGVTTASIGGHVYEDLDSNGVRSPLDPGLGGVPVTLFGTDVLGHPVSISTTTATDGSYQFNNLIAGAYAVVESPTAGHFSGSNTVGSAGGVSLTNLIASIPLAGGASGTGYDFGDLPPASLSGVVYYDYNRNGQFDSGDFGIAHTVVTLTGTDHLGQSVMFTTATDANGAYSFPGLRAGTYTLAEAHPTAFRKGHQTLGSAGGVIGTNVFSEVALGAGADGSGYNFGELQKPGCRLADIAFHVGRTYARDAQTRSANPASFDARNPVLGEFLRAGLVPRGVGTYPTADRSYYYVPTLGRLRVPLEPWVGHINVPNQGAGAAGRRLLQKLDGQSGVSAASSPHQ